MTLNAATLRPGDVIVTRSPGWMGRMIRIGAAMLDVPSTHNHVILAHHIDDLGHWQGIEARGDGIGWRDLDRLMDNQWAISTANMPRDDSTLPLLLTLAEDMVGKVAYDYRGIAWDALTAVGINRQWQWVEFPETDYSKDGRLPAYTVCSAAWDWGYEQAHWPNPGGALQTRRTTPGNWSQFALTEAWRRPGTVTR